MNVEKKKPDEEKYIIACAHIFEQNANVCLFARCVFTFAQTFNSHIVSIRLFPHVKASYFISFQGTIYDAHEFMLTHTSAKVILTLRLKVNDRNIRGFQLSACFDKA